MRQRIYIDTSVIGGYFDEEFEEATKRLFYRIQNKDFDIYFSVGCYGISRAQKKEL
jgi:predicted nucleic acid-binding protein